MTREQRIEIIRNRIEILEGRQRENRRIIKKLERKIRQIENER